MYLIAQSKTFLLLLLLNINPILSANGMPTNEKFCGEIFGLTKPIANIVLDNLDHPPDNDTYKTLSYLETTIKKLGLFDQFFVKELAVKYFNRGLDLSEIMAVADFLSIPLKSATFLNKLHAPLVRRQHIRQLISMYVDARFGKQATLNQQYLFPHKQPQNVSLELLKNALPSSLAHNSAEIFLALHFSTNNFATDWDLYRNFIAMFAEYKFTPTLIGTFYKLAEFGYKTNYPLDLLVAAIIYHEQNSAIEVNDSIPSELKIKEGHSAKRWALLSPEITALQSPQAHLIIAWLHIFHDQPTVETTIINEIKEIREIVSDLNPISEEATLIEKIQSNRMVWAFYLYRHQMQHLIYISPYVNKAFATDSLPQHFYRYFAPIHLLKVYNRDEKISRGSFRKLVNAYLIYAEAAQGDSDTIDLWSATFASKHVTVTDNINAMLDDALSIYFNYLDDK